MGLGDSCLVGFQDHLGAVIVDMEGSEDEDQSGEGLKMEQSTKHKLLTQREKVMSPNQNRFCWENSLNQLRQTEYEFNTICLI